MHKKKGEQKGSQIMKGQNRTSVFKQIRQHKAIYLMALPAILWYVVFKYIPLMGSIIAFQNYSIFKGILESPFVGFNNFRKLFAYPDFYNILRNSIIIGIYDIILSFPMPLLLALSLNEVKNLKYKKGIQTIVYLPHFLSWVVVGSIFINVLLSPEYGLINRLLQMFGFESIFFMASSRYIRGIVISAGIWRDMGYSAIVYIAAISAIDPSLYEAAQIDGAGKLSQIFYITLPSLTAVIVTMLLLKVGHFMDFGFERIWIFLSGVNQEKIEIFDTFIYRVGLQGAQFSFSTTIGLFKSVVGLLLLLGSNYISKRLVDKGLF